MLRLSRFFIVSVVGAAAAFTTPAASAQEKKLCEGIYEIARGDTLSRLASRVFGNSSDFLRFYEDERNKGSLGTNPNNISIGAILYLPPCDDGKDIEISDKPAGGAPANTAGYDPFAETIDVVTASDFAPFTDESLQQGGMLTTVVADAFERSGLDQKAKIVFINDWGSQLDTLLPDMKYTFSFPWYKPDCSDPNALSQSMRKRCELVWSDPLFSVIIGYYALATQQNIPDDFSGFKDRTLCRPDGYFTFDLENEGLIPGETITLRQPGSVKDCFEMLEKGEVDFVTINRFTAEKAIAGAGLDGLVLPISSVVSSQDLHLVGHQHNPDAVRLMRGFNEGLRALKEEGRSQRITRFFMQVHQEQIDAIRAQ